MTAESIQNLRRLRELCGIYIESVEKDDCRWIDYQAEYDGRTMPPNVLNLLDEIELANRKLEKARAALEFYADDSIQTREVVTQYKDSPPWTGFVKETGDDRRKSDKGRIARAALAELEGK